MDFLNLLLCGVLRSSLSLGLLSSPCLRRNRERECHLGLSWDGLERRGLWTLDLGARKDASLRARSDLGCALAVPWLWPGSLWDRRMGRPTCPTFVIPASPAATTGVGGQRRGGAQVPARHGAQRLHLLRVLIKWLFPFPRSAPGTYFPPRHTQHECVPGCRY